MVSIKKTAILLIEKPIFCINTGKRVLLGSYNQEICDFFDRNQRQAAPLANTSSQRFKASSASYAEGSLRLLCALERRESGNLAFHRNTKDTSVKNHMIHDRGVFP